MASISTPVLPIVWTVASMETSPAAVSQEKRISIPVSSRGWHIGIRSPVFFAAMIPAIRATAKTSPLGIPPSWISAAVSGRIRTVPRATALRSVGDLAVTSTIRARPFSSRWDSFFMICSVGIPRIAEFGVELSTALLPSQERCSCSDTKLLTLPLSGRAVCRSQTEVHIELLDKTQKSS